MSRFGDTSVWSIQVATLRSCFRRMEESESHLSQCRNSYALSRAGGLPCGNLRGESVSLRRKARNRISSVWQCFLAGIGTENPQRATQHWAQSHCVGPSTWKDAQSHFVSSCADSRVHVSRLARAEQCHWWWIDSRVRGSRFVRAERSNLTDERKASLY